jgi:hypothetical protein
MGPKLLVAAAVVLLVAACGGDDTTEPAAPQTTTPAVPSPTASPDDATPPPSPPPSEPASPPATAPPTDSWSTDDVSVAFSGTVPPTPTLVALRVGSHPQEGYDRMAFEFSELPGYQVGYREEIVYDGSGEPVALPGEAFLQLVFNPAQAHDDEGNSTLATPPVEPVTVGSAALESYVLNGDFEGYVAIALGLTAESGFRVDHFTDGNGNAVVYIDVARP